MAETTETKKREIIVGSCEMYMKEFTGEVPELKTREQIMALCVDANRYGHTKGGCTLTYAKETDELVSDDGKLRPHGAQERLPEGEAGPVRLGRRRRARAGGDGEHRDVHRRQAAHHEDRRPVQRRPGRRGW